MLPRPTRVPGAGLMSHTDRPVGRRSSSRPPDWCTSARRPACSRRERASVGESPFTSGTRIVISRRILTAVIAGRADGADAITSITLSPAWRGTEALKLPPAIVAERPSTVTLAPGGLTRPLISTLLSRTTAPSPGLRSSVTRVAGGGPTLTGTSGASAGSGSLTATHGWPATDAGALVDVVHAGGLSARRLGERAPFDLVFANILLPPLKRLAAPIAHVLAPGAHVVLSGLLAAQAPAALAAYGAQGLRLAACIPLDEWVTLVLSRNDRPGRKGRAAPIVADRQKD